MSERPRVPLSFWFFATAYVVVTAVTAIVAWRLNSEPSGERTLPRVALTFLSLDDRGLVNGSLANADLTGVSAKRLDITGGSLVHADLTNTDLSSATLVGTDLRDARLVATVFVRADFTGACLRDLHFESADLSGAILDDADLRGADLATVQGTWESIDGALYDDDTRWPHVMGDPPAAAIDDRDRSHPACRESGSTG